MTKLIDDLRELRARLADPAMWHQGDYFKDFPSHDISDFSSGEIPDCPSCIYGAAAYVSGIADEVTPIGSRLERLLPDGFNNLAFFNDHHDTTHADVLGLIDKAIAQQEQNQ